MVEGLTPASNYFFFAGMKKECLKYFAPDDTAIISKFLVFILIRLADHFRAGSGEV